MSHNRKTISIPDRHAEYVNERMDDDEDDFTFSGFVQAELDRLMAEEKLKEE